MTIFSVGSSLTMDVLQNLPYSIAWDLGHWFLSLLKRVPFAGLTASGNGLDIYNELNSEGLAQCKCSKSPGDTGYFKKKDIPLFLVNTTMQNFKLGDGEGDVPLSATKEPRNAVTSGCSKGKPQICPRGLWEGFSKKVTWLIDQLKCFYTNAHNNATAGGDGSHGAIRELYLTAIHRNMVGKITQLEYY